MAWDQLSIDKPHLVYIILGGFTTLFMLCSSVIKERLYIGEATVATLCGLIFGPNAANLINPGTWGNTDFITLEFSRIVLVVQCFAVGVELPRAYMEKHWKSVVLLLVPVMTFGWLITSLFIWAMFAPYLNWLDSLVCAACVTATDPVLASSVVGKGKFAKRVPKHLRDLLSAESGCNDGMAFPFIYLGLYIVMYYGKPHEVALHWICITILYECVFGAIYGVTIGYIARRAIRYAHDKNIIDRESFLVFYFVLALFCAGSGSLLGMDDLLIGFACGVGFSNDGWFTEKTEESHVSNVIDLLINLAFFVYFGTIIPWAQFNSEVLHIRVWKLVVIAFLVLFFRRIPIMMALKPIIPDIKTWREALFAGHFGPIGVGAIFVAILARAELETGTTTPLADISDPDLANRRIVELIWPITTFLVLTSIIVHGSSIAVFTLGKHINTLTVTMSYTQASENDGNWMDRLPRIQSRSKSSMSAQKEDMDLEFDEKGLEYPAAALPRNFLRRQRTEDTPAPRRASSRHRKSKAWAGAGGHVDPSAIEPQSRSPGFSESETLEPTSSDESPRFSKEAEGEEVKEVSSSSSPREDEPEEEVFREGDDTVFEDEQGNVLEVTHADKDESARQRQRDEEQEARKLMRDDHIEHGEAHSDKPEEQPTETKAKANTWKGMRQKIRSMNQSRKDANEKAQRQKMHGDNPPKRAPARAFRFGRTIIVEDEDGEVIKKYDIPAPESEGLDRRQSYVDPEKTKQRLTKMGRALGVSRGGDITEEGQPSRPGLTSRKSSKRVPGQSDEDDDRHIRFTVDGQDRRMSKTEFIKSIEGLNPKARMQLVEESDAPEVVKDIARADAQEHMYHADKKASAGEGKPKNEKLATVHADDEEGAAGLHRSDSQTETRTGPDNLKLVTSRNESIPFHSVTADLRKHQDAIRGETAAQRRRRLASSTDETPAPPPPTFDVESPSEDEHEDEEEPQHELKGEASRRQGETAAERRRREAALGTSRESDSDEERRPSRRSENPRSSGTSLNDQSRPQSIRFANAAETPAERRRRIAALGTSGDADSDSDDDNQPRRTPAMAKSATMESQDSGRSRAIQFADAVRPGGKMLPSVRRRH